MTPPPSSDMRDDDEPEYRRPRTDADMRELEWQDEIGKSEYAQETI